MNPIFWLKKVRRKFLVYNQVITLSLDCKKVVFFVNASAACGIVFERSEASVETAGKAGKKPYGRVQRAGFACENYAYAVYYHPIKRDFKKHFKK